MTQPQLPPTEAIAPELGLNATTEQWFEYPIQVYPNHTDYGGRVWHGTYIKWLEEARVESLRHIGFDFAELVAMGCDLPVVEINLRYHRALKLGEQGIVKSRLAEINGVKMTWSQKIQSTDNQQTYLSGRVILVAIDPEKGKIMRQLPPIVKDRLVRFVR